MFRLFFGCSKETFKPVKKHLLNSKQQDFSNCTSTLLGRGNIHGAVQLPDGEDLNEWLAANSKFALESRRAAYDTFNFSYAILSHRCEYSCRLLQRDFAHLGYRLRTGNPKVS